MTSDLAFEEHRQLTRAAARTPACVEVPTLSYLMVDGRGDPGSTPDYGVALGALFAVSYALKFRLRAEGVDYKVAPPESLWWAPTMEAFTSGVTADRSTWEWTAMIAQPAAATPELVKRTADEVAAKKKELPGLDRLRLAELAEGRAVQVLHVGPWSEEGPVIAALHSYAHALGLTFDGQVQKHHEIYLSDTRRVPPERWRTVVRQPVVPV